METERLRTIKTESESAEIAGVEYKVIRLQDFDWFIEQAERAEKYNKALLGISTAFRWGNTPLQDIKEELRKVGRK